jgi:predicted amidohydrolase
MEKIIIALAQSVSERGNIVKNLESHSELIKQAAEEKAQLIIFPELSLTGYEMDLANEQAFSPEDKRLIQLRELSTKNKMTIIAGAPIRLHSGLHIGVFIINPYNSVRIYTKRYLHPGEDKYFEPAFLNPTIKIGNEIISLAICADIANPQHAEDAAKDGTTIYLVSALISKNGYNTDSGLLKGYADKYKMTVMLSNHGGDSGGYDTAGRSAVWLINGKLLSEIDGVGEGLLIVAKENEIWNVIKT